MNRLPGDDQTTQRSELLVFASLGFAGVMLIALATVQMTEFVASRDGVVAALTVPSATATSKVSAPANLHTAARGAIHSNLFSATESTLVRLLR